MMQSEPYISGSLWGVCYSFDSVGEGLQTHRHLAPEAHNIIVLEGKVLFHSEGVEKELTAGEVFDFDWGRPHRVDILEAPARLLNLCLHGQPNAS